jgi:hypothetical protein
MMQTTMQNVAMMEVIAVVSITLIPTAPFANVWTHSTVDALMPSGKEMDIVMMITTMQCVNMMEEIAAVIALT